ncbi:acyl-CoA N-acyltransferase [Mariannaea sp. PMI_226]|nr:acyl-CoA N-acyltransferase [Mariannaea sp. PMI_226]
MSPSTAARDSPPIQIRIAKLSDVAGISEMGLRVFTATFGHSVAPHELAAYLEETYTVEAITKDIYDTTKDVIVATNSENRIVGFAYLTRGTTEPCLVGVEKTVELQRIYVDLSTHSQGVGSLLSSTIDQMAREQGFKNIWLGVWEENKKAIRAYQKWGYRQVGDHDFALGSVIQRDEIMLKSL